MTQVAVNDGGFNGITNCQVYNGGWHQCKGIWVYDGGWAQVWVNQVTSAFNFTAATHTGTITNVGYYTGSYGTMNSGGTLPSGNTIHDIRDTSNGTSYFAVGGFSSDPGSGWLVSVTSNGATRTGASASYSYGTIAAGVASWEWTTATFGFSSGTAYSSSVTYS